MAHELHCPHRGCPLLRTPDTVRVLEMETVELLCREIEHLRATVARLRGRVSTRYIGSLMPTRRHPDRLDVNVGGAGNGHRPGIDPGWLRRALGSGWFG